MPFDVDGALKAGASEDQILGYLRSSTPNYDVDGALKAGASKRQVIDYLASGSSRSPESSVPGMEKLGGTPPAAGKPPADINPAEYPDEPKGDSFLTSPHGLIRTGLREAKRGVEEMAEPGWDPKFSGASKAIRGFGKAVLPAAIPAAIANPLTAAAAIGTGGAAQFGVEKGTQALGASPAASQFAGDVAGLVAGGGVAKRLAGPAAPEIATKRSIPSIDTDSLTWKVLERVPGIGPALRMAKPVIDRLQPQIEEHAAAPPPLQGSSLARRQAVEAATARPKVAPPPLMKQATEVLPAEPSVPAPPLMKQKVVTERSPVPKPAKRVPPPPLQGSSAARMAPAEETAAPNTVTTPEIAPPANGGGIVDKAALNRMVHFAGSKLGMDHEALSNLAYQNYRVKSMADLTDKQLLDMYAKLLAPGPSGMPLPLKSTGKPSPMTLEEQLQESLNSTARRKAVAAKPVEEPPIEEELPQYAKGGIIRTPKLLVDLKTGKPHGIMAEKGPEAIVPLTGLKSPERQLKHIVNSETYHEQDTVLPSLPDPGGAPKPDLKSGQDIIRGSSNIPLSPAGRAEVTQLGKQFAQKGGLDSIITSDLTRAVDTAKAISKHTGAPVAKTPGLHPWHLGGMEGQPTQQVLHRMNHLILKKPNVSIPGRGPQSTLPGESFNAFKRRALGTFSKAMADSQANPEKKTALVTHYRDLKLLEAWLRKGAPPSQEIDRPHMTGKGDAPGSVHRLFNDGKGWKLEKVNMKAPGKLKGGLYVVRHGLTAYNAENNSAAPEPDEK